MESTQMKESTLCPYCLQFSAKLASFVNATSNMAPRSTTRADSSASPRGGICKTHSAFHDIFTAKTCDLCWLLKMTLYRNSIYQTLLRSAESQQRHAGDQAIAEYDENGISDADEPNETKFDIGVVFEQDDLPQEGLCELAVTFLLTIKDRFRKAYTVEIHESLAISISIESPNIQVPPDRLLSLARRVVGLSELIRLAPGPREERWPVERLPARFIEISGSGPVSNLSARLIAVPVWYQENPEGNPDFVALSHRWGDMGHSMTTTNNVAERMGGFAVGDLPHTFINACFLTSVLGLKYLWIDALCIIQDSHDDWATESLKMGDVFRGAHVVLAAHSAQDSSQGFLTNTLWWPGRVVRLPTKPVISLRLRPNFETEVARSHLSKRGWVMQERLLATRTLHFTEGHIFLESPTDIWAEGDLDVPGVRYKSPSSVDDIKEASRLLYANAFSGTATSSSKQRDPWATLVEWYSVCDLTREEDKLVAIHGIATLIQRTRDCLYFSGLWSDNFHTGLLWLRRAEELTFPKKRRAPSWSWASVEGPLQYCCDGESSLQPAYTSIAPSSDGTAPEVLGNPMSQLGANGLRPAVTCGSKALDVSPSPPEHSTLPRICVASTPPKKRPLWLWPRSKAEPPTGWSKVMPNLQYPIPVFPILEYIDDGITWTASRPTRPGLARARPPDLILGWVTLDSHGSRGEEEGDIEKILDDWVGRVLFARIARREGGMVLGLVLATANGLEYTRIGFGQLVEEQFGWQPETLTVA